MQFIHRQWLDTDRRLIQCSSLPKTFTFPSKSTLHSLGVDGRRLPQVRSIHPTPLDHKRNPIFKFGKQFTA